MNMLFKKKAELTIVQVASLACIVGSLKSRNKAVKTMFGLGALGTTVWSILKGVHLDAEDEVYAKTNLKGVKDPMLDIDVLLERCGVDKAKKTELLNNKVWQNLESILSNIKAPLSSNSAVNFNEEQCVKNEMPENDDGVSEEITPVFDNEQDFYENLTAPFVYKDTVNAVDMPAVSKKSISIENIHNTVKVADTTELSKTNDTIDTSNVNDTRVNDDFDLLADIEPVKSAWLKPNWVNSSYVISDDDKLLLSNVIEQFGYSFIKEQGPSKFAWFYCVRETEDTEGVIERFVPVSVDIDSMMSAYRDGGIQQSAIDFYEPSRIYDNAMSKHITLKDIVPDTVYVSDKGTVLVLLGRSNSKVVHTVASKHCKRVGLVTLGELSNATCKCLWS